MEKLIKFHIENAEQLRKMRKIIDAINDNREQLLNSPNYKVFEELAKKDKDVAAALIKANTKLIGEHKERALATIKAGQNN